MTTPYSQLKAAAPCPCCGMPLNLETEPDCIRCGFHCSAEHLPALLAAVEVQKAIQPFIEVCESQVKHFPVLFNPEGSRRLMQRTKSGKDIKFFRADRAESDAEMAAILFNLPGRFLAAVKAAQKAGEG